MNNPLLSFLQFGFIREGVDYWGRERARIGGRDDSLIQSEWLSARWLLDCVAAYMSFN
jgi:hypothetical protein